MNRTGGDSVALASIPLTVQVAGTYANGRYATTEAQVEARFPRDKYGWVRFDVDGSAPQADARDWETGDKAGSLEQWVIAHNRMRGRSDAVVYCNRLTIPEVRKLTGTQVLGRDYWLYVATLDGTTYTAPGVIACQFASHAAWDEFLVYDDRFFQPLTPMDGILVVTSGSALTARLVTSRDNGKTWT